MSVLCILIYNGKTREGNEMSVLCILIYNGKTRKGNKKGKLTTILKPRITMVNLLSALKIWKYQRYQKLF